MSVVIFFRVRVILNHQATAKINGHIQRYIGKTEQQILGVARGAWLVVLFIICKPVMSTPDNRNELISGCKHSNKFLLNTVLTWLVLVANLTCCKHRLSTTRHAPTPRLTFIVLFYLMIRLAGGITLCRVAINVQDIIQSHQSTSITYTHIYSFIKKLKLMQPPPPSIIERSMPKNTLSATLPVIKLIH